MSEIAAIRAREVLNSRGQWTLAADVVSDDGIPATAYLPLGKSTSPYEPTAPDMQEACQFVNSKLATDLCGMQVDDQSGIDAAIQAASQEQPSLGNALMPVSVAVARMAAGNSRIPLWRYLREDVFGMKETCCRPPVPFLTLFMGGIHRYPLHDYRGPGDTFQAVQIILETPTIRQCVELATEIHRHLAYRLIMDGSYRGAGEDRGMAARGGNERMIRFAQEEVLSCFDRRSVDFEYGIAIDVAARHLRARDGRYRIAERAPVDGRAMFEDLCRLVDRYPIWSVEDPFDVDEIDLWQEFSRTFPDLQVIGDDIFACSAARIAEGAASGIANTFLLKPELAGTVTGVKNVVKTAEEARLSVVVSHRSGETCDSFVADLAAAVSPVGEFAVGLRAGACSGGERTAKWNRLLAIADEAGYREPVSFRVPCSSRTTRLQ